MEPNRSLQEPVDESYLKRPSLRSSSIFDNSLNLPYIALNASIRSIQWCFIKLRLKELNIIIMLLGPYILLENTG